MSASAVPGDKMKARETFEELCTRIENGLGVLIPTYIKNILIYSGFDNKVSLRALSDKDIDDLNKFVKGEAYYISGYKSRTTGSNWNSNCWSNFYGTYANQCGREKFTIPPGHERLLFEIADYLQQADKALKTIKK